MEMQVAIETITPQIAEKYLELNDNIRKITWGVVDKYADDMKKGRWLPSSEAIAFDKNGMLKDGQHRLHACIKSGCSFQCLVVRNLPEGADSVIDIGKSRNAADQLKGIKYSDKIAALAKMAYATKANEGSVGISTFIHGKRGFENKSGRTVNKTVSIPAQVDDAKTNLDEYLICVELGNRLQKKVGKFSTTLYAYFVWLVRWLNEDDSLKDFIDDFCAEPVKSKMVSTARTAIFQKENRADRVWLIAILLYTYANYRDGKELEKIIRPIRCLDEWNKKISDKSIAEQAQEEKTDGNDTERS